MSEVISSFKSLRAGSQVFALLMYIIGLYSVSDRVGLPLHNIAPSSGVLDEEYWNRVV